MQHWCVFFHQLVSNAIQFLASVSQRPNYKHLFEAQDALQSICEKIIVPNMEFRGKHFWEKFIFVEKNTYVNLCLIFFKMRMKKFLKIILKNTSEEILKDQVCHTYVTQSMLYPITTNIADFLWLSKWHVPQSHSTIAVGIWNVFIDIMALTQLWHGVAHFIQDLPYETHWALDNQNWMREERVVYCT